MSQHIKIVVSMNLSLIVCLSSTMHLQQNRSRTKTRSCLPTAKAAAAKRAGQFL